MKAEEKTREQIESLFQKIFEEGPIGIALVGLDYRFIKVNSLFCRMTGYTAEDLISLTVVDITHKDDIDKDVELAKKLYVGEIPSYQMEKRYITKGGDILWINLSAYIIRDSGGNPLYFIAMIEDIAKQKDALEEISLYSEIVRNMEEGVYLVRASDSIIVFANPKFERMFGYGPGELTGRHVSIINAPSGNTHEETAREIIETLNRTGVWSGEVHNIKKDGTPFWCHATVSTFNHHRYGTVWVSNHLDISERKQAEEKVVEVNKSLKNHANKLEDAFEGLKEVDRLKNMFISTMSHELRTPLNSIIGFSSIMLNEWIGLLNDEQKKNLATVHRSGQYLLTLINDVIDISKIEAGMLTPNIEEFDLNDVISEAVNSLLPQIKERGLEIAVDTIHQPMRTDRRRLLQSVLNLLSNAVKFTEKGRVFVGAGLAPARNGQQQGLPLQGLVDITVSDTGIGINEEDMPKLFQSFIRIDSPLRAKVGGTGLGLHLTKKLITEILKGEILVSSRYGEGSRFVMRIPWRLQ